MSDIERARDEILNGSRGKEGLPAQEAAQYERQLHGQILQYNRVKKEAKEKSVAEAFNELLGIKEQYAKEQEMLNALYKTLEEREACKLPGKTPAIRWERGREPCSKETRQTIGRAAPWARNLFRNLNLRKNRDYHKPFAAFYFENTQEGREGS